MFITDDTVNLQLETDHEVEQHEARLNSVVQSWGFAIQPVSGDGNCLFTAVSLSLKTQTEEILSISADYFVKKNICITDIEVSEVAQALRRLMVQEWLLNKSDYTNFLTDDSAIDIDQEAVKFYHPRYFHGPLADTMVLALCNALQVNFIIFSSALHHPILHVTPRETCLPYLSKIVIYLAYHQYGAGHYDAVIKDLEAESSTETQKSIHLVVVE